MPLPLPRQLFIVAFALLASLAQLSAEIALACQPPQLVELAPPVFPAKYAAPENRRAYSIAVFCDKRGSVTGVDSTMLPVDLRAPAEAAMRASKFRPAASQTTPVAGFRRVLLTTYFTPVNGRPTPTPRFRFDEAARDKLETIARTVVRGWLRIRFTVSRRGGIRAIETQNSHLDAVLETLMENDVHWEGEPFEPAMAGGRPAEGQIDLFWDFTLPSERADFREVETELVKLGANALPADGNWPEEDFAFKAHVFPHESNAVIGAYLDPDVPTGVGSALLSMVENWFIPDKNAQQPLEVALRFAAEEPALVVESFRSIPVTDSSLRFSARPIYPKRRFLPDPDGFVRVAMIIGTDGWLKDVQILEASHGRFREPAFEALAAWHFSPMTFDGQAIPSKIFLTMPFDPDEK